MSRNGSGTYVVPNTFTPSTTISSSAVNANFTDVGSELTNSLALDGQSTMTGQFKATDGTITAPGIGFGSDTNTGFYRSASGTVKFSADGTNTVTFDANGITGTHTGAWAYLPSGTVMLFAQTNAPTGWTKSTTHNNKALRVVSGAASSGGSVDFTTAFASQAVSGTVGNTTLTVDQIPSHTHVMTTRLKNSAAFSAGVQTYELGQDTSDYSSTSSDTTQGTGGGAAHTHTFTGTAINLAVAYVDVILASKD